MHTAIDNTANKAAYIDSAKSQVSTLLEDSKGDLHDAAIASREAEFQQKELNKAIQSQASAFRSLAATFRDGGLHVDWYNGDGDYAACAALIKDAIVRALYTLRDRKDQSFEDKKLGVIEYSNKEMLAAYLADDTAGMDDRTKALRHFAKNKGRVLCKIMADEHVYLNGVDLLEADHDIYMERYNEEVKAACGEDAQLTRDYMAKHPPESFGKDGTRWATGHKAIAAYLANVVRAEKGILAPSEDIAHHLSSIHKVLDKTVDKDFDYDIPGEDRVAMRSALSDIRQVLERNLPGNYASRDNASRLVTLLTGMPE